MLYEILYSQIMDISSITNGEYVRIVASYYHMTKDLFNCEKCTKRYMGRLDGDQMLQKARTAKGCFGVGTRQIGEVDSFAFYTCPANLRLPSFMSIYRLCEAYKNNINPFGGSLADTPAKFVEISNVVHNLIEEDLRKESQKHGRKRN